MIRPVILAVDDDRTVLNAVERDLRRQYGKEYRILAADSGQAALKALHQLTLRNDPVALLLVDQRMPEMSGVEFLDEARKLYPEARRALLTAYADTDAAIRAINQVKIHYYLMKPWDPPEVNLYPVLQDLLDDWQATFRPPFHGVRVVAHRWSAKAHQIKDFLARNQIPYRSLDAATDEEAARLMTSAGVDATGLPLVVLDDGTHLAAPSNIEIAEKIGLRIHAGLPSYDLIIVGGGPAGLAAAVYGASEGLKTLLLEREAPGGQAGQSSRIENYLGFPSGLSGADLARRAAAQAAKFGAEVLTPQEVSGLTINSPYKVITLADGTQLNCRALLIATGVSYRKLDVPGVEELTGVGVYYGASITEALSANESDVYIVGAGNSAGQAALYLAKYARRVTLVVRSDSLSASMSQYLIDQIAGMENVSARFYAKVVEVKGRDSLQEIVIADTRTGECETLPAVALFIFIGAEPRTEWAAGLLERDTEGYILSGPDLLAGNRRPHGWDVDREPYFLETSVPGVFVAGDVRHQSIKRIASAVGEGAMAVQFIHRYLATL